MLLPLPIPTDPNPYHVHTRTMLYESPWIRLREDRFQHRGGAEGRYPVCGFQRTACGVLAVDRQDQVLLVGQWRYPLEHYSWELPEGGGLAHESPFEAMQRELVEEGGVVAQNWSPLSYFNTSNSSTDEETFLFLAEGIQALPLGHAPEADEELAVLWEPFQQCLERVRCGEITDSLTVVGLLQLQAIRTGVPGGIPAPLAERFFQRPQEHPSPGRARWEDLRP